MKIKNTMTKGDAPVERSYFSNPSFFAAIMMICFSRLFYRPVPVKNHSIRKKDISSSSILDMAPVIRMKSLLKVKSTKAR